MVRIDGEIVINRPVDAVFEFVADERNEPRYNPRMLRVEKLSPGPIGLGTWFRAAMTSRPRPAEMTMDWTGYYGSVTEERAGLELAATRG